MLDKYKINFKEGRTNIIEFWKDGELINNICCPPAKFSCDIIGFNEEIHNGYQFAFKGLLMVADGEFRTLYCEGKFIDKVKII